MTNSLSTFSPLLVLLLIFALLVNDCNALFTQVPKSLHSRGPYPTSSTSLDSSSSGSSNNMVKPILVVGATGKVGRKVVRQLLDMEIPVRALVRDFNKARELFSDHLTTTDQGESLKLEVWDLGTADRNCLESVVEGCEAVISVSGAMRFSKFSDFLPWRLFQQDASNWCKDRSHPVYANYKAQQILIDLAAEKGCTRFVRLTGLSSGFSPFNPVSMIFSSILSLTSRYHFLCEQYLRNSGIPYVILRPGGLAEDDRDLVTTNLQVDSSGSLPPPGRVPRTDVAALAALSVGSKSVLDPKKSYTLAVRAVGDMKPKPQGNKDEGFPTPEKCLESIRDQADSIDKSIQSKPYGLAVGIFVYSLLLIGLQVGRSILGWFLGVFFS